MSQLTFNFDEPEIKKTETIEEITENPDLDGLTEEDIAKQIKKELGIEFKAEKDRKYWTYKKTKSSKEKLSFRLGNYNYYSKPNYKGVYHKERYIGVSYDYKLGGEGCGFSTVDDAIKFFKRKLERMEQNAN